MIDDRNEQSSNDFLPQGYNGDRTRFGYGMWNALPALRDKKEKEDFQRYWHESEEGKSGPGPELVKYDAVEDAEKNAAKLKKQIDRTQNKIERAKKEAKSVSKEDKKRYKSLMKEGGEDWEDFKRYQQSFSDSISKGPDDERYISLRQYPERLQRAIAFGKKHGSFLSNFETVRDRASILQKKQDEYQQRLTEQNRVITEYQNAPTEERIRSYNNLEPLYGSIRSVFDRWLKNRAASKATKNDPVSEPNFAEAGKNANENFPVPKVDDLSEKTNFSDAGQNVNEAREPSISEPVPEPKLSPEPAPKPEPIPTSAPAPKPEPKTVPKPDATPQPDPIQPVEPPQTPSPMPKQGLSSMPKRVRNKNKNKRYDWQSDYVDENSWEDYLWTEKKRREKHNQQTFYTPDGEGRYKPIHVPYKPQTPDEVLVNDEWIPWNEYRKRVKERLHPSSQPEPQPQPSYDKSNNPNPNPIPEPTPVPQPETVPEPTPVPSPDAPNPPDNPVPPPTTPPVPPTPPTPPTPPVPPTPPNNSPVPKPNNPSRPKWNDISDAYYKKHGTRSAQIRKATDAIAQQMLQNPGASKEYILEKARAAEPTVSKGVFEAPYHNIRETFSEMGVVTPEMNDFEAQKIVDANLRAKEMSGWSDDQKRAEYDKLVSEGKVAGLSKEDLKENLPKRAYRAEKKGLKLEKKSLEAEIKDYDRALSGKGGHFSHGNLSDEELAKLKKAAEEKLKGVVSDLEKIRKGYGEWAKDALKPKLFTDQINKTLQETEKAIDKNGVADVNYKFSDDVKRSIDSGVDKDSIIAEGRKNRRRSKKEKIREEVASSRQSLVEEVLSKKNPEAAKRYSDDIERTGKPRGLFDGLGQKIGDLLPERYKRYKQKFDAFRKEATSRVQTTSVRSGESIGRFLGRGVGGGKGAITGGWRGAKIGWKKAMKAGGKRAAFKGVLRAGAGLFRGAATGAMTGASASGAAATAGASAGASVGGMAATGAGAAAVAVAAPLIALGAVAAAAGLLATAFKALENAAGKAVEKMLDFSKFDANLLVENFKHKGREFSRNVDFAQQTSESGAELIEAWDDMQDKIQPLKVWVTNFKNKFLAGLLKFVGVLIDVGDKIVELFKQISDGVKNALKKSISGIVKVLKKLGFDSAADSLESWAAEKIQTSDEKKATGSATDKNAFGEEGKQEGAEGKKNQKQKGVLDVQHGDYTAYDVTKQSKEAQENAAKNPHAAENNKKEAEELAKSFNADLKAVQNDPVFQKRLARRQMAGRNLEVGVNISDEELRTRNAGKNRGAVAAAAGFVDGEAMTNEAQVNSIDIVSDHGKRVWQKSEIMRQHGELAEKYYKSGKIDDKALENYIKATGDEKTLKEYEANKEATKASFARDLTQNRYDYEQEILSNKAHQSAAERSYYQFQALDISSSAVKSGSKEGLEEMLVAMKGSAASLQLISEYTAETMGYSKETAENTKPESKKPNDLMMNLIGMLANQKVEVSQGYNQAQKQSQYGRYAGQFKQTNWGLK